MPNIDVTPIIPNTTMQRYDSVSSGKPLTYKITPIDGYVLHDKGYDATDEETGITTITYRRTTASVGVAYDFSTTQVTDLNGNTVTAYGSREFYTLPESDVPEDQI